MSVGEKQVTYLGPSGYEVSYTDLVPPPHQIARQVCVDDDVIFDVDSDGRPLGVETIGRNVDWSRALVRLAMMGQMRLDRSIGQDLYRTA